MVTHIMEHPVYVPDSFSLYVTYQIFLYFLYFLSWKEKNESQLEYLLKKYTWLAWDLILRLFGLCFRRQFDFQFLKDHISILYLLTTGI